MFQMLDFHAPINQQRPQQEKIIHWPWFQFFSCEICSICDQYGCQGGGTHPCKWLGHYGCLVHGSASIASPWGAKNPCTWSGQYGCQGEGGGQKIFVKQSKLMKISALTWFFICWSKLPPSSFIFLQKILMSRFIWSSEISVVLNLSCKLCRFSLDSRYSLLWISSNFSALKQYIF